MAHLADGCSMSNCDLCKIPPPPSHQIHCQPPSPPYSHQHLPHPCLLSLHAPKRSSTLQLLLCKPILHAYSLVPILVGHLSSGLISLRRRFSTPLLLWMHKHLLLSKHGSV